MHIKTDDLTGAKIQALLQQHLDSMILHSPPESIHALDLTGLRQPDITFWSIWDDGEELLGCGALKELEQAHGEIKSMRTATPHLRKGVAAHLVEYIIGEARRRNYHRLSLETGSMEAFFPAHQLYRRFGFQECGPFNGYVLDPYSIFMTLEL